MSSRILLTNEILNNIDSKEYKGITLSKSYQKNTINYYFLPTIGIQLFDAKVTWIDPLKKHISFSFYKYPELSGNHYPGSLNFIKKCYETLTNIYKNYEYDNRDAEIAPFFHENGDYYYIRCYLPKSKYFYNIISEFEDEKESIFNIPQTETIYKNITIEFRNIWEDTVKSKRGFNIELKHVRI